MQWSDRRTWNSAAKIVNCLHTVLIEKPPLCTILAAGCNILWIIFTARLWRFCVESLFFSREIVSIFPLQERAMIKIHMLEELIFNYHHFVWPSYCKITDLTIKIIVWKSEDRVNYFVFPFLNSDIASPYLNSVFYAPTVQRKMLRVLRERSESSLKIWAKILMIE